MLGGNGPNVKSDRLLLTSCPSLTTASLDYRYTRAHKASDNRHFDRFHRQTTLHLRDLSSSNRGKFIVMAISTMKRNSSRHVYLQPHSLATQLTHCSSSNSSIHSYASSTGPVRASCYALNASTAALSGFHYRTTLVGGVEWCS